MKKVTLILSILIANISITIAQKSAIFIKNGKALNGYDPVAFFTENKPTLGNELFTYQWQQAIWQFSTKENKDSFVSNPNKYAPKYGGYCAYGAADGSGHKAPTDINTWTVLNNQLYFNYSLKVKEIWLKKQEEFIIKADNNWDGIKNKE